MSRRNRAVQIGVLYCGTALAYFVILKLLNDTAVGVGLYLLMPFAFGAMVKNPMGMEIEHALLLAIGLAAPVGGGLHFFYPGEIRVFNVITSAMFFSGMAAIGWVICDSWKRRGTA